MTMLQGLVDFTKDPVTICVINPTDQDLILKSSQVVADLSPIELSSKKELSSKCTTNTEPFLQFKMGETSGATCLHT